MISWTRRFNPNAFSRLFFSDRGSRTARFVSLSHQPPGNRHTANQTESDLRTIPKIDKTALFV